MTTCPIEEKKDKLLPEAKKIINLQAIGKRYPLTKPAQRDFNPQEFWALEDVSFDVYEQEILGIIGRNGAGKTTLLNIIAGTISATQGKVNKDGKILGLFNLGVGFQDELTGRENIFLNGAILGAQRKELENKLNQIIEFSELGSFINMPLGTYSQGMRLRLGFSIIANLDFEILLIDEVLAVGDVLFQHKCFQRIMELKRAGKTLVITNQSMDLIERLCDRVILLDHGRLLFQGQTKEGINQYHALLSKEKFFVGPLQRSEEFFEDTKKWADESSRWGNVLGTKEVVIDAVKLVNKFGLPTSKIGTGEPLKIRVNFTAKNTVKEPHFGVAIFRNDGVYCYGTNTAFDGFHIPELRTGKGSFSLSYRKLLLAPGEYRISVAIWDKNETLAFIYHEGYHRLTVTGYPNPQNEILHIPFKSMPKSLGHKRGEREYPGLAILNDKWGKEFPSKKVRIESVKLFDSQEREKEHFITNEALSLLVSFSRASDFLDKSILWIGLYRDDGVYCQGILIPTMKCSVFKILFPHLHLLPGSYRISLGIWDSNAREFLMYKHAIYSLKMIFQQRDHGTVYLEHSWRWR